MGIRSSRLCCGNRGQAVAPTNVSQKKEEFVQVKIEQANDDDKKGFASTKEIEISPAPPERQIGRSSNSNNFLTCSKMDLFAAPPNDIIENLVRQGRVIPCENHGSASYARYHRNISGVNMAFYDSEARRDFAENNRNALLSYGSWERVDIAQTNADWAMRYGSQAFEIPFSFRNFKKRLEKERASMVAEYAAAVNKARAKEPQIYKILVENKKYASFIIKDSKHQTQKKPVQPTSDLFELYVLSVAALPQLWKIVRRAADCARKKLGRHPLGCITKFDIKKLMRAQTKLSSDYQGQVELLTDVARASLVCEDLAELQAALDALLDFKTSTCQIVSLKNRWASPVDGYADILMNIRLLPSNVLCEIQLNTKCVYSLKGDSGHQQYKWLRRLVQPDDIYHGERDSQGRPHGNGRRTFACGDYYEGTYFRGQKHGIGKYQMSDGTTYQGEFYEDKRHGRGFLRYSNGNSYDGEFKCGKIEGQGTKRLVNGGSYTGQWRNGKPDGFGEQIFKPGDIYVKYTGSFRQGCKDGRGLLQFDDGSIYEGSFFCDRINGDGRLSSVKDGSILQGKFANGTLVEGMITKSDGSVLQGRFKNGVLLPTTRNSLSADPSKRRAKFKAAVHVAALTATSAAEFSSSTSSLENNISSRGPVAREGDKNTTPSVARLDSHYRLASSRLTKRPRTAVSPPDSFHHQNNNLTTEAALSAVLCSS